MSTDSIPVLPQSETPYLGEGFRLLDRYELQNDLIETLQQTANHRHLIPRIAACHRSFRHWRCENNHSWAEAEDSCSLRICPHCSRRRSLILSARVEKFLATRVEGLRYVVLSERNSTDLESGIASLFAAWTRLRRWVLWKRRVKGCIAVLEVTRNAADGTWHPHLNVLFEGEYFPVEHLHQAWVKATRGNGSQVWISAANSGTVRELIKYVTKLSDLLGDAGSLDEFLTAIKGQRLVRTYGTFFGMKVDDDETLSELGCCPDCGPEKHVAVLNCGPVSAWQLRLDFDGVLRISGESAVALDRLREAVQFPPSLPPEIRRRPVSSLIRHWDHLHQKLAAEHRSCNAMQHDGTLKQVSRQLAGIRSN